MNPNTLFQIATWLIPLIIAIVFHEVSHGLVARRLGDPTAEQAGRLTFNPIRHVDLFGTVILPLMLALSHAPVFGWAKPVPVNYRRLRHPRRDMVLVALAGPGMNLLLAVVGAMVLAATLAVSRNPNGITTTLIAGNAMNFVLINLFLAVFNLLPVPPFDGGHVVEGLLPPPLAKMSPRPADCDDSGGQKPSCLEPRRGEVSPCQHRRTDTPAQAVTGSPASQAV
jgi:Zn-dependent protease